MPRRRTAPPSGDLAGDRSVTASTSAERLLDPAPIRLALLAWYRPDDRDLPFRATTDPWGVLVSEAMAQQTQAARAGEAWTSFMARFPGPAALAAATPAEVLRAWRGLGYNRRALALQRAAAAIVAEHGGRVPSDVESLERLPGVGPYTARAVAAIAFGTRVGAVDTNVRRVISRLVGIDPAPSPRHIQAMADDLVDPERPGEWAHAVMDLGARVCRARVPDCPACPLRSWCVTAGMLASGRVVGRRPPNGSPGRGPRRRAAAAAERPVPFSSSSRWLRGRIVDRLRDAPDGDWTRFDGPIGEHPSAAVMAALDALARDGLIERDATDPRAARLPLALP